MTESRRYPAQVFWSDEDEGFIAVAPDLPGCSAFGDSREESLEQLQDAIEAWIEAATAAGNEIPQPSKPAEQVEFSGKFLARVPRELHRDLVKEAEAQGVSLNQYVIYLLARNNERRAVTSSARNMSVFISTKRERHGTTVWHPHTEEFEPKLVFGGSQGAKRLTFPAFEV